MPNYLRAAIRELTETLTSDVLKVLRSASFSELQGNAGARGHRGQNVPRPRRGRPSTTKGGGGADTLLDRMVAVVRRFPQGIRSEDLRTKLKAKNVIFRLVAQEAIAAGLITRTGEKRMTTYLPK